MLFKKKQKMHICFDARTKEVVDSINYLRKNKINISEACRRAIIDFVNKLKKEEMC